MGNRELRLNGGLTNLRVTELEEFVAVFIETRKLFQKDPVPIKSMLAMLDNKQQRQLMEFLQRRLK